MKKINYLISLFLITLLIDSACGFAGMTANNSTAQPDPGNTTESDLDISLLQHLIVIDAVQLQSENKLNVHETLIFKNTGTRDFSGSLRTWLPDGAEIIKSNEMGEIIKSDMTTGGVSGYLPVVKNGNIISWRDYIQINTPASLYVVEYVIKAEPTGTLTKTQLFTKKLTFPTLINYRYEGKSGYPGLIIMVTGPEDISINLYDENRNVINPQETNKEGNSITNRFYSVQFKELNVGISKSAVGVSPAGIAGYVIIGALILLVLSYPILRKRSGALQSIEEKIKNSLKKEPEENIEEESLETPGPPESKMPAVEEQVSEEQDAEFSGMIKDELENQKNELLSKISELDKEYASGNLLDEEYEEKRNAYLQQVKKIDKKTEPAD